MKYTQKSIILFYLPQKLLDIRNAKKQRKADLAKRRTYASQQRMKMITQLVSGRYFNWTLIFMLFKMHLYLYIEQNLLEGHNFKFIGGSKKKKEDTFGQNDADWEVYKEIVRIKLNLQPRSILL